MVMLTIPESIAFAHANNIRTQFLRVAAIWIAVFVIYLVWLFWNIKKERRRKNFELQNVKYLLNVEQELFNAHQNPEQFSKALQLVSEHLMAETVFFWSARVHSENELCFWTNRASDELTDNSALMKCLAHLFPVIQDKGSFLCYDAATLEHILPECKADLDDLPFDSLMVVLIQNPKEQSVGLLGAYNLTFPWKNTEPLEQVAFSFSMAFYHYAMFQTLDRMGQIDSLTGLYNRNRYHIDLERYSYEKNESLSCVYIDANGLHELNNSLGHEAGDEMLKSIADALRGHFPSSDIYRIGGDEFVILCRNLSSGRVQELAAVSQQELEKKGHDISVGIEHQEKKFNIPVLINSAEEIMQQNKRLFYENDGRKRQLRIFNDKSDQMKKKQKDTEAFLEILSTKFKGVYFVNLEKDTLRALFIPPYFAEALELADDKFGKALQIYKEKMVKPENHSAFEAFLDYDRLKIQLDMGVVPECIYQKNDGAWLKMRVLKLNSVSASDHFLETLWVFEDIEA